MQLLKNQLVRFKDGHSEGWLEARWSEKNQAFYSFTEDGEKIFSTDIITKQAPKRKNPAATGNRNTCTVKITPCGETEKAYQLYDGSNGRIGRGLRHYYKYVAKSICWTDENGNIYAPKWAL